MSHLAAQLAMVMPVGDDPSGRSLHRYTFGSENERNIPTPEEKAVGPTDVAPGVPNRGVNGSNNSSITTTNSSTAPDFETENVHMPAPGRLSQTQLDQMQSEVAKLGHGLKSILGGAPLSQAIDPEFNDVPSGDSTAPSSPGAAMGGIPVPTSMLPYMEKLAAVLLSLIHI